MSERDRKKGKGSSIGKEEMKVLVWTRLEARKPVPDNNRPGTAYEKARRKVSKESVN